MFGGAKAGLFGLSAALLLATLGGVEPMAFDMQYQTKCLFQDIENGQASTIEWRSISKRSVDVNFQNANVFSEEGESVAIPPPPPYSQRPDPREPPWFLAILSPLLSPPGALDAEEIPINVAVTSPVSRAKPLEQFEHQSSGKVYISADHGEAEGDYKICFSAKDQATASDIKLLVDWRVGALAQDWEVLAKKEHIDHISVELQKYEDLVKEMRQEMIHMKKVDKIGYQTREAAHKRVEFFSFLTMLVCIGFTVGQYFFLKKFFKNKKLL